MIDFKEFDKISDIDRCLIDNFIDKMCDYIPVQDIGDYVQIKKYLRKILEVIEKGEEDE